ncbi:MAG: two component regulator propeller domain protein [Bacteroidetes bacterium]|jgi:photosystem II stability/assembly factor-like uncharacterized protein|nr:two component regulator propeller domain protein [Bacteroidota bacterium]
MKKFILFFGLNIPLLLTAQWTQGTGLFGGPIMHLKDLGSTIIASSYVGGCYISTDTGNTWQQTNLKNKNIYRVLKNGNYLIACGPYKDYSSSDNFQTYTIQPRSFENIFSIQGALYTNTYAGVYQSTDSGLSYHSIQGIGNFNILQERNNIVYKGTSNGLFSSSDSMQTWQRIDSGFSSSNIISLNVDDSIIIAGTASGAYRFNNGAWNPVGSQGRIECLIKYNNKILLHNSDTDAIYISSDQGITWAVIYSNNNYENISSITTHQGCIFICDDRGIRKSIDEGLSWSVSNNNISTNKIYSIIGNSTSVFAGSPRYGIWRSVDQGNSWLLVHAAPSIWTAVDEITTDEDTICAVQRNLLISKDNGNSWSSYLQGKTLMSAAKKGNHICASDVWGNIYFSSDGGNTWDSLHTTLSMYFSSMTFHGNILVAVGGGNTNGTFRSYNYGASWQIAEPNLNSIKISSLEGKLYACAYQGGLYVSNNNGSSWQQLFPDGQLYGKDVAVRGQEIWFANSGIGVLYSPDYGVTWDTISPDCTNEVHGLYSNGNYVFAATPLSVWNYSIATATSTSENFSGIEPNAVNLFPNPAQNEFRISFNKPIRGLLKIYNSIGELVFQDDINGTKELSLNLKGRNTGIYFIEINLEDTKIYKKIAWTNQ